MGGMGGRLPHAPECGQGCRHAQHTPFSSTAAAPAGRTVYGANSPTLEGEDPLIAAASRGAAHQRRSTKLRDLAESGGPKVGVYADNYTQRSPSRGREHPPGVSRSWHRVIAGATGGQTVARGGWTYGGLILLLTGVLARMRVAAWVADSYKWLGRR
jgi:hypothetical protein